EIVINKAQVASLKSLFIDKENHNIFTSAVANSKDGKGQPFTEANFKWPAFGESQKFKTDEDRNMQGTEIGFAFSSPMLLLAECERMITLSIILWGTGEDFFVADVTNMVTIYTSGEMGSITPKTYSVVFAGKT